MELPLTGTGIWSSELRYGDRSAATAAASELEELGYSALWVPDVGGDLFPVIDDLLAATTTATIATGILNLWMHEASEAAAQYTALTAEHGDRFLVGIGVSHAPLIDSTGTGHYEKPLSKMRQYLDDLDATDQPIPQNRRVLAALGPKMLELARTRSAGAHPYLVTPEHTALTRQALGVGPLVAAEQALVLDTVPETARATARAHLAMYLGLPNYANNWKRQGFTEDDIADGGSDRLVDALVAWGDEDTLRVRVQAHRDAGADHVCVQVLTDQMLETPLDQWRRLAPVLTA